MKNAGTPAGEWGHEKEDNKGCFLKPVTVWTTAVWYAGASGRPCSTHSMEWSRVRSGACTQGCPLAYVWELPLGVVSPQHCLPSWQLGGRTWGILPLLHPQCLMVSALTPREPGAEMALIASQSSCSYTISFTESGLALPGRRMWSLRRGLCLGL